MVPVHSSSWMQTHLPLLGNQPVHEIFLPASHDSGMYAFDDLHTTFGTSQNVLTQSRTILQELELGVRRFEIRPTYVTSDGKWLGWYTGHFTLNPDSWGSWLVGEQGGCGASLRSIIDEVNEFTESHGELVVLDMGHMRHIDLKGIVGSIARDLSDEMLSSLLGALKRIKHCFSEERAGGRNKLLQDFRLGDMIGDGEAAVLVIMDCEKRIDDIYNSGCWPSKLRNVHYLPHDEYSVLRQQTDIEAIVTGMPTLLAGKNQLSVLQLAAEIQYTMFPYVLDAIAAQETKRRCLQIDRVENTDLLTLCLAVTLGRLQRTKGAKITAIYGGKLVVNDAASTALQAACTGSNRFKVCNETLGGDPWPGMVKSCAVYWWQDDVLKSRFAREGEQMRFDVGIAYIVYGPAKDALTAANSLHGQIAYSNVSRAFASGSTFLVNNNNLGGDPCPGVPKLCNVGYTMANGTSVTVSAFEGEMISFA